MKKTPAEPTASPQFDYTGMLLSVLGIILILGILVESRWYFLNLINGPIDTTLREISKLPPGGINRNWVRVKCPKVLDSGYQTVITESWSGSEIESLTKVVSNLKVIPIGKHFLAANVPVDHSGTFLVGALLPMPTDTRIVLGKDLTQEEFDKIFLPYILETNAYKTSYGIGRILLALLGLTICIVVFIKQVKHRLQYNCGMPSTIEAKAAKHAHTSNAEDKNEYTMGLSSCIDQDRLEWQVSHWKWLTESLRKNHDLRRIRLIQPTTADFPVVAKTREQFAIKTFECVQKHFALEAWPCTLLPFEEAADAITPILPTLFKPETSNGAAGLFEVTNRKEVIIRYKQTQIDDPMSMVATMAHEMCHYVLATIPDEPPSSWNNHELITDLTAVFFGFGIFLANSSFRFSQWQDSHSQGWSARSQGYLSEEDLSLALAIFCACKNVDPKLASRQLSTNPRHYFRSYYKELTKQHMHIIQNIKALEENVAK